MPGITRSPGTVNSPDTGNENLSLENCRRRMDEHYNTFLSDRARDSTASVGNPQSIHLGHYPASMPGGSMDRALDETAMLADPSVIMAGTLNPIGDTERPASAASALEKLFKTGIAVASTALNVSAAFMGCLMPADDRGCDQPCHCHHGCDCGCAGNDPCCCCQLGHPHKCTPSVSGCG